MSDPVVIDSEWGFKNGWVGRWSHWEPVVLCARLGGDTFHFLGRDHRLPAFVEQHRNRLWVSHSAVAEQSYLLRLGIPLPPRWWCTRAGHRIATNRSGYRFSSLNAALSAAKLGHLISTDKEAMQQKCLHLAFTDADIPAIIAYCMSDVDATAALHARQLEDSRIAPVTMHYYGEYLAALSTIEARGVPIEPRLTRRILRNAGHIVSAVKTDINAVVRVYVNGAFNRCNFLSWCYDRGIMWPTKISPTTGRPYRAVDDDTLEVMSAVHPFIRKLRDARKIIDSFSQIAKNPMVFDGWNKRHYYSHFPFATITGRNSPSKWIFGAAKWMRWLAVAESPDHILLVADFKGQEIGIAARLADDPLMSRMYAADDPHLFFAAQSGAVPAGADEETLRTIRGVYKVANLAILYGQGERALAENLSVCQYQARDLLAQHRRIFARYHDWSARAVRTAFTRGTVSTVAGWRAAVGIDTKARTWANYPVQGAGADAMRLITIALDRLAVKVIGIIHDAWLISCRRDEETAVRERLELARRAVCDRLFDGYPLKLKVDRYEDRYQDKDGRAMWDWILRTLPSMEFHIEPE